MPGDRVGAVAFDGATDDWLHVRSSLTAAGLLVALLSITE